MALDLNSTAFHPATGGLFDAVLGREGGSTRASYKCAGCGDDITFDSLAATCRCSQECYVSNPAIDAAADVRH